MSPCFCYKQFWYFIYLSVFYTHLSVFCIDLSRITFVRLLGHICQKSNFSVLYTNLFSGIINDQNQSSASLELGYVLLYLFSFLLCYERADYALTQVGCVFVEFHFLVAEELRVEHLYFGLHVSLDIVNIGSNAVEFSLQAARFVDKIEPIEQIEPAVGHLRVGRIFIEA